MKGKNVFRIVIFTLIILFGTLYITQALGYYEYSNRKINTMTEAEVKKIENDIKSGKKVDASDYVKKKNDYNNRLSKSGMAISKIIDKLFTGIMNFLFSEVDKAVNDN